MELLRRALLVGCLLPALWLFRLAPLDPLVSVVGMGLVGHPVAGLPDDGSYVTGEGWDLFLRDIDALGQGLGPRNLWRVSADVPEAGKAGGWVFFRPRELPAWGPMDRLAAGAGTTIVSFSRPEGDLRYQVDRREWTRQEFRPGAGFTGRPTPPASLLYPFQNIAFLCVFVGVALFALIPSPTKSRGGVSPGEVALLALALALFAGPLLVTGGSVQAFTRGFFITLPCWALAALAIHFFAKPGINAPHPLFARAEGASTTVRVPTASLPTFLRWGLTMLAVAVGPLAVLVAVSMTFWNR
jgi:hypothetical protein